MVQNGIVTGIAPGNAVVTATKDGKSVAEISVSVNIIDISAILFSQKNVEIELEESMQLQYILMPDNASDYGLSWKSANTEIAEVDDNGNIRAVAPGTTNIVCSTPNGVIDTCEVVVKEPSAIEQLNEEESKVFNYMTNSFLKSFYNASAARLRNIYTIEAKKEGYVYSSTSFMLFDLQGTNRMGGTLFKYYMVMVKEDGSGSYFACKDGFSPDSSYIDFPRDVIDYTKINAALDEYWGNTVVIH